MAEKTTQALRRWLEAGKSVADALACAGIPPSEHEKALADLEKEHLQDVAALVQLAQSRVLKAVDILEELANGAEDDKVRVTAAKALLDLGMNAAKMKLATKAASKATEKEEKPSLWDFT